MSELDVRGSMHDHANAPLKDRVLPPEIAATVPRSDHGVYRDMLWGNLPTANELRELVDRVQSGTDPWIALKPLADAANADGRLEKAARDTEKRLRQLDELVHGRVPAMPEPSDASAQLPPASRPRSTRESGAPLKRGRDTLPPPAAAHAPALDGAAAHIARMSREDLEAAFKQFCTTYHLNDPGVVPEAVFREKASQLKIYYAMRDALDRARATGS